MEEKTKIRSEVDIKYKWDLSKLYKSLNSWHNDVKKLLKLIDSFIKIKGSIMKNSINLYTALSESEAIDRIVTNLYVYANMKYHEDTTNNESIALKGEMDKIMVKVSEATSFVRTEILESDYSLVEKYINELIDLQNYKFLLDRLFRQKKHILSANEEKLLASMGEVLNSSHDIYDVILDTDFKYDSITINNKEIEVTNSNFVKLLKDDNQDVRRESFNKYYKSFKNFKNTFASTLKYNIKSSYFISKIRHYDDPLSMTLYHDDVPLSVYNNLIDVVNKNLDVIHKYISLRKKELNVNELHMYDIYANIVESSKNEYTYEEAKNIIKEALKPLGKNYLKLLDKAFDEHWIDVYNNVGKKSGAYSWGTYDSKPYILLNYMHTLDDIFTLAHELGHSMHSYLTNKNQPITYAGHSIFTAEVASTVNEILLSQYLLNQVTDKKEKKIILNELMEKFKGTLYRQTMFAEFEKTIFEKEHNNEILTESLISDLYYDLNKKYYGRDIIHDEQIRYEWMRIPHFYTPFYVYQYATGISAACTIAYNILNGDKKALKNYLKFLSSGDSDYPINLLRIAGVDMSKQEPIEKAIKLFDESINEYLELTK